MTLDIVLGGGFALAMFIYLFVALARPERF